MKREVDAAPELVRRITDPIGYRYMRVKGFEESKRNHYDINTEEREIDRIHSILVRKRDDIEKVKSDFLNGFAWRTMAYSPAIVILTLLLYLIGSFEGVSISLLSYGLSIEVTGAIILGRGLLSDPVEIANQATIPFGGISDYFSKSLATDAADGIWGVSLILLGAAISGISTVGFG